MGTVRAVEALQAILGRPVSYAEAQDALSAVRSYVGRDDEVAGGLLVAVAEMLKPMMLTNSKQTAEALAGYAKQRAEIAEESVRDMVQALLDGLAPDDPIRQEWDQWESTIAGRSKHMQQVSRQASGIVLAGKIMTRYKALEYRANRLEGYTQQLRQQAAPAPVEAVEPEPHPDCTGKPDCMCPPCAAAEEEDRAERVARGSAVIVCPTCNNEISLGHRLGCAGEAQVNGGWATWAPKK